VARGPSPLVAKITVVANFPERLPSTGSGPYASRRGRMGGLDALGALDPACGRTGARRRGGGRRAAAGPDRACGRGRERRPAARRRGQPHRRCPQRTRLRPPRRQLEQLRVRLRPGLGNLRPRHRGRPRPRHLRGRRDRRLGRQHGPAPPQPGLLARHPWGSRERRVPGADRQGLPRRRPRLRDRTEPCRARGDPRPAQPQADRPARVRERGDAGLGVARLLALGRDRPSTSPTRATTPRAPACCST
jgi:hypothetical protein